MQAVGTVRTPRLGTSVLAYDAALLVLVGLVAICLQPVVFAPSVPFALKLELAAIVVATLLRPAAGLLIVAALVPFSATAVVLWDAAHVRWADTVVLAFLAGWGLDRGISRRRGRLAHGLGTAAFLFGAIIVASCVVQVWQLDPRNFMTPLRTVWRIVSADLLFVGRRVAGVAEGVALLQGLTLFIATIAICKPEERHAWHLATTIVIAAVAAAILSILLAQQIGLEEALRRAGNLSMVRVAAHISDVNAAGSYFAMTACLALGMAVATPSVRRIIWLGAAALIATGLWLTGSRAALAAGVGAVALMLAQLRARQAARLLTPRMILLAVGLGLVALIGVRRAVSLAPLSLREQFLETSLRMVASAPVFGVGVGQFYPLSRRFMSPELGWSYSLENAHNYFLQIAAELGIVGIAALMYLFYVVWTSGREEVSRKPELLGVVAGLGAFLATSLTGHPLLVREVAYPFWMTLALVVVWAKPQPDMATAENASGAPIRGVMIGAMLILFASVPFRTEPPTRRTVVYGVHDWEQQPDGRLARWTDKFATVIVRAETASVELAMRAPRPTAVDVAVDGRQIETVPVTDMWRQVRVALPAAPDALYRRIDLRLERTWLLSEIVPGATDHRMVGIQLGDVVLSADR